MRITNSYLDFLTYELIGCAIEVHKELGPGLIESVYEKCLIKEMEAKGFKFESQVWIKVLYKGVELDSELRLDLLVEDMIIVELKSVDKILPVHIAQVLTYMKLLNKPKGLLINFNCTNIFKEGQKTLVNSLYSCLSVH